MAFEGLSSRLQEITRKLKGKARITESDLKDMLREVKLALLEADVISFFSFARLLKNLFLIFNKKH